MSSLDNYTEPVYLAFSHSKNIIGWLIRLITRSRVDHTFFIYYDSEKQVWMTSGAMLNGVRDIPLSEFEKGRKIEFCFMPSNLLFSKEFYRITEKYVGRWDYNYLGVVGLGLQYLLNEIHEKKDWLNDKDDVFCSQIGSMVIDSWLKRFLAPDSQKELWPLTGVNPNDISPQRLLTAVLKAPYLFIQVNLKEIVKLKLIKQVNQNK